MSVPDRKDTNTKGRITLARWSMLSFAKRSLGLDRAIAFTIMARFWSAMAGAVTVVLIARFLTPEEQGYYYTFYSVVALQIVFELGFSFVILQLAAHERAQLNFLRDGQVEGDAVAHSRLASVLQKAVRWYSVAGLIMAAFLIPTGMFFFRSHGSAGFGGAWRAPWCLLVLAAMLAFQIDPVFSFLEGCGFVSQVARRRLAQGVLGSFLAWTALATHHGLYSPAMVILGQVAVGFAFLLVPQQRHLLRNLLSHNVGAHFVGWRREIWPFQWRIAISWLSGFFISQLFSPVLFAYQGPVAAGQMGMSLNIASGIGAVGISWMMTKASPFGALVARRRFDELDKLFFKTLWQSSILLAIGAATFFTALMIGEHFYPKFANRVLSPWAFALLLIGTIVNHIVTSQALYLRAHKEEPFLLHAVLSAVIISCSTLFLGKYYGANAVVLGLFVQGMLFGLPYATFVFISKRRAWLNARSGSMTR